jgi:long-chain acyl-CoA synthetase
MSKKENLNIDLEFSTIADLFFIPKKRQKTNSLFKYKINNEWKDKSFKSLVSDISCLINYFEKSGYERGDKIGLVSENRIEWIVSDFACAIYGLVSVPVFPTLTPSQLLHIFNDSQARAIIISSKFQLDKISKIRAELNFCKEIFIMDDLQEDMRFVNEFQNIVMEENANFEADIKYLEQFSKKIKEEDLLTIIYTSGTTGEPKGVMLTHKNLVSNIKGALDIECFWGYEQTLSYLPLCHAFERMAGYYTMYATGTSIAFAESIDSIATNIREISPQLLTSVPKLLDTIRKKIIVKMSSESNIKQKIFDWATAVGKEMVYAKQNSRVSLVLNSKYRIAYKLVFDKIIQKLGGRLQTLVVGGAALHPETAEFFEMLSITTIQGYGLTECSPVISVNRDWDNEFGTVGKAIFNVEVKIASDGEILARGPNIMQGYYKKEKETREMIDSDGWLHTGDVGIFTKHGNIKITDRKKNIFVSSGGKNIIPAPVENAILSNRNIDQIIMFGDGEDYCTALVVPNFELLKIIAEKLDVNYTRTEELVENNLILKYFRNEIEKSQKDFSKFEKVRKFKLLPKAFSIESGELSPKMSIKKHIVKEKYNQQIRAMYG